MNKLFSYNKAESGITTLVLFIALILVASIAAMVFIQMANSLQNKSLYTGQQVKNLVSSKIEVLGTDRIDSLNTSLYEYRVKLRLAAGSDGISLKKSLLSIDGQISSMQLQYSENSCINDPITGYYADGNNRNGTYSVNYLIRGGKNSPGYLFSGDIIQLCFAYAKESDDDRIDSIYFFSSNGQSVYIRKR